MSIRDPGERYPYLVVETDGQKLLVLKRNRAIRFDAFLASEPISEEDKLDTTLSASEVPRELWDVMTAEEQLTAVIGDLQNEIRQLKRQRTNLSTWLVIVGMIGWSFALLFFVK